MATKLNRFAASMSEEELENGELLHLELEKNRRTAMICGLTKSSDQLFDAFLLEPDVYLDALKLSVNAFDHYENLLILLAKAVTNLHAVAEEIGIEGNDFNNQRTLNRALEVISNLKSD